MKNVLVTSIGSVSGEIVIKRLRENGYYVVGIDIYPYSWVANARDTNCFIQVSETKHEDVYKKQIREIIKDNNIDLIVPLTDVDVDFFSESKTWLKKSGIMVCISKKSVIDTVRNKKKMEEYVENASNIIKSIPTRLLEDGPDDIWELPMIIKPINGRSSQKLKVITSYEELYFYINNNQGGGYIIEPFVDGENYVVDVVCQNEYNRCVAVSRKELIRTVNGCGVSVQIQREETLERECALLSRELGVTGCINYELIKDKHGQFWFLECNPRFSAGVVFSLIAGYDFVENHMRCFEEEPIVSDYVIKEVTATRRFCEVTNFPKI